MSFLFKQKARTEAVNSLSRSLKKLNNSVRKKDVSEVSKNLSAIRTVMTGEGSATLIAQLCQEFQNVDLLMLMVENIAKLEFESKKDVVQIFSGLLWRQVGTRYPTAEYICSRLDILETLVKGYEDQRIALNCGMILRECIQHPPIAKSLINLSCFWNFFEYVELQAFDVASDAIATFKDLLTKHKEFVSEFLEEKYDIFFSKYSKLLSSSNYVTKRQSLKLLGELLLDRSNFSVMFRYIGDADNLKLIMNLLRNNSKSIRFEAFHIFKVFVVNPNKTKPVLYILEKNKEKLISFLEKFNEDRTDDVQFTDEKSFIIKQLNAM